VFRIGPSDDFEAWRQSPERTRLNAVTSSPGLKSDIKTTSRRPVCSWKRNFDWPIIGHRSHLMQSHQLEHRQSSVDCAGTFRTMLPASLVPASAAGLRFLRDVCSALVYTVYSYVGTSLFVCLRTSTPRDVVGVITTPACESLIDCFTSRRAATRELGRLHTATCHTPAGMRGPRLWWPSVGVPNLNQNNGGISAGFARLNRGDGGRTNYFRFPGPRLGVRISISQILDEFRIHRQ